MRFTAKHYAEALRASISSADALHHCADDLSTVAEHLAADSVIRGFFTDRATPVAKQERVLRDVFQDFLSEQTYKFLRTLIVNRQFGLLDRIIRNLTRLIDIEEGTTRAVIESATPLDNGVRERIEAIIADQCQRRIIVSYAVDPRHIAGFRLTLDGVKQWDGTIRGKFARLHRHIRSATVT